MKKILLVLLFTGASVSRGREPELGIVCLTLTQGRSIVVAIVASNSIYHALQLDNNGEVMGCIGLVAYFKSRAISTRQAPTTDSREQEQHSSQSFTSRETRLTAMPCAA